MSEQHWTPARLKELHALRAQGVTLRKCADTMGVSYESVRRGSRLLNGGASTASPPAPAGPIVAPEIQALIKATRGEVPRDTETLCNILGVSPKRLRELVATAQADGYAVHIADGIVGRAPIPEARKPVTIEQAGASRIFAVLGDPHVGSKYFLKEQMQDFIHNAYAEGVRDFLCVGDILDGCYGHSMWEETHHGFHEQATYAAEVFPRLKGARYIAIGGNHDETFEVKAGIDVCSQLPQVFRDAGRDDLTMLGMRGAYVRLRAPGEKRGLLVELWHPGGGVSYAVSYKLQKHIESFDVGQKPDVLLGGHTHKQVYLEERGVHAFWCGTWHGGVPKNGGRAAFSKMLGGAPKVGSWIIRYALTPGGTVRSILPEWKRYYEAETVRDVELG